MTLSRWFQGMWARLAPRADTTPEEGAEQVPSDPIRQSGEAVTTASAPAVSQPTPGAFTRQFLDWTSRQLAHGPADARRLESLMTEFAEVHDLTPLEPVTLCRELDRLGIASHEPDGCDRAPGLGQPRADGRRQTGRFYVLPQRFANRPSRGKPSKPAPPGQFDLFKRRPRD